MNDPKHYVSLEACQPRDVNALVLEKTSDIKVGPKSFTRISYLSFSLNSNTYSLEA
jgi:hypothetical protein